jgi:hypothetical protein
MMAVDGIASLGATDEGSCAHARARRFIRRCEGGWYDGFVLTIKEVRKISGKLKAEKFLRELGPFALIQRPMVMPGTGTEEMGIPMNARTTQLARPDKLTADVLSLIFEFDELIVATLPPMEEGGELIVGR